MTIVLGKWKMASGRSLCPLLYVKHCGSVVVLIPYDLVKAQKLSRRMLCRSKCVNAVNRSHLKQCSIIEHVVLTKVPQAQLVGVMSKWLGSVRSLMHTASIKFAGVMRAAGWPAKKRNCASC